jgi:hypothetical protein
MEEADHGLLLEVGAGCVQAPDLRPEGLLRHRVQFAGSAGGRDQAIKIALQSLFRRFYAL